MAKMEFRTLVQDEQDDGKVPDVMAAFQDILTGILEPAHKCEGALHSMVYANRPGGWMSPAEFGTRDQEFARSETYKGSAQLRSIAASGLVGGMVPPMFLCCTALAWVRRV